MIEFIISGVVCLICVVIAVLVFMKVDDIRNLNSGTHAGREVMIWLESNPNAPISSIVQKTKEIERQNKDSKIVLKMTPEEFDSMISTYHSKDAPGSFLVIVDDTHPYTKQAGKPPPEIEYIYNIKSSFPYQKYVVWSKRIKRMTIHGHSFVCFLKTHGEDRTRAH